MKPLHSSSAKWDRTRLLISWGNSLRLVGYDRTHCEQKVGQLGKVLFQALVVASAPHPLCDFVVIDGTGKFSQQGRYMSVAKPARGSLDVAGQEVLGNLPDRTRFRICGQPFS